MYRFLLTPRWWSINVFVVLAIPFCVFMGSWQLGRFEDRVDSQEQYETDTGEGPAADARPLAALLPVDKETSGERARVTGRYDTQLLVPDRTLDDRNGHYVLTMLRTDQGKALPVVRGWLPGAADPARAPEPPAGEVTVTGFLQSSETRGTTGAQTDGGLPPGRLGMISAAALINIVDYPVYDAWITLTDADGAMTPVPAAAPRGSGLDLKAFQNLGYTGEWFVFAGFVLFMWFRLLRREIELARDQEIGITPADPAGPADPDDAERKPAPASTA